MLFRTLEAPRLRRLSLELESQNFSVFLDFLARPLPPLSHPSLFLDPDIVLGFDPLSPVVDPNGNAVIACRSRVPFFPALQELVIVALEFDDAAIFIRFLRSIINLTHLDLDVANVKLTDSVHPAASTFVAFLAEGDDDHAIVDAFRAREDREKAREAAASENARGKGKARALEDDDDDGDDNDARIPLPHLKVVRLRNACPRAFVRLARFRRRVGRPVKRWELHERARWIEYDENSRADVGGWDAVQAECAESGEELVWVKVDDEDDEDDDEEDEEDCNEDDDEHGVHGAAQTDGVATGVVDGNAGIANGAISESNTVSGEGYDEEDEYEEYSDED